MGSQKTPLGRNAQVVRILNILRELDRLEGADMYELAARFGTAERTIRRDLEALQEAGFRLEGEQDGKKKRWRFAPGKYLAKLSSLLDASHYLALRVAMGQAGAIANTSPTFAALEDLAEKIEAAVGPKGRAKLAAIEACFHSYDKFAYREAGKDFLLPLVDAISERRVCRVGYRAATPDAKEKRYEVLPLKLLTFDRAVYLLCRFEKHGSVGTLNLRRLRDLKVLDRTAEPPKDFDPDRWENAAFGIFPGGPETRYVLRFDPQVAHFIRERLWHPSQDLRELPRGGVQLEFTCGASYEVTSWVASWREWVEVAEPPEMKEDLATLGSWLCSTYGPIK